MKRINQQKSLFTVLMIEKTSMSLMMNRKKSAIVLFRYGTPLTYWITKMANLDYRLLTSVILRICVRAKNLESSLLEPSALDF